MTGLALLCSGQGTQHPQMLDRLIANRVARRRV